MKVYLGDAPNMRLYNLRGFIYRKVLVNFWLDGAVVFDFFKDDDVICDSGAFSFMVDPKRLEKTDIDRYCDNYCEYINKYHIEHFFEMDVDTLLGTDKAAELRKRIERNVKRAAIPVWHCERGKRGWEEMCDSYDYVALPLSGKNATSKWLHADNYRRLWWFVEEAHKRGARIHALGLGGNTRIYKKGAFFSCDSVTYTYAVRSRSYAIFNPSTGLWEPHDYERGTRFYHVRARWESLKQWRAFAEWAEVNL